MKQVTIVGLGLIGGSLAKAIRERSPETNLVAVDRGEVGARADVQALVSAFITPEEVTDSRDLIKNSDLVVLCQPVRIIADTVSAYVAMGTAVTDTGSTKRRVVERASQNESSSWFVPGHPMAGKAQGGFEHASASLFEGRPWILCPAGREASAVARVECLIELVGAKRITMSPEEHDSAVAITSHVPQLLASWLRLAGTERHALAAAGPAFSEMTRTAGGADAIWQDIFETNADEVGEVLRDAAFALAAVADALLANPPRTEAVLEILRKARASRSGDS